MINTIIFDMDGVLLDSVPQHRQAFAEVFRDVGVHVSNDDFREVSGMTTPDIIRNIAKKHGMEVDVEVMSEKKDKKALEKISKDMRIFDGVRDVVKNLRNNGFRIGFASSSDKSVIDHFMEKGGLKGMFDSVVMGIDLHRSKPDPEVFLLATEKMGSRPESSVVVEDARNGIIAAKRARMKCIAIKNDFIRPEDIKKADVIVNSIKEITPEMIRKL
ncbi:MAG: HAD family phosphatase [Candidatus Aenigmarchaeota archaeon]|nr:HAD family phosphatase [Candidatus Aenigmarchaeota archaeon]